MTRHSKATVIFLIALIGWIVWGLYSTARQTRLDRRLTAAVESGDAPAVGELLHQGADPNTRENGDPPPSWEERLKAVFGVRPRHRRYRGTPVLDVAVCNRRPGGMGQTPVHVEIVGLLVAKGADVNARNDMPPQPQLPLPEDSPLMAASMLGHTETARILVDGGANVNATDGMGWGMTPMHRAAMVGDAALVQMLLDRGAVVNARNAAGRTALMVAADRTFDSDNGNTLESVRTLIAHGADINARDQAGETALGVARITGQYRHSVDRKHVEWRQQIRAYLVQHGAKE